MPDKTDDKPREQEAEGTVADGPDSSMSVKPEITPLRAVVELLKRGHREMLPRLRELLREEPQVWQHVGNLAGQSRRAWIELFGGKDDLLKESAALYADERVKEIAGDDPSPLEQLLAERIVAHELRALYLEALDAQNIHAEGTPIGEFRMKKQEIADRQLARAIKLLANVRGMLARPVAIEVKMADTSPPQGTNGRDKTRPEKPKNSNGHTGVNRLNGYNHVPLPAGLNEG